MTPLDLLLLVALGVAFWLLLIRPNQRRRAEQAALVDSLAPGTRIMTTAGVFGTVVGIEEDRMRVEIAPGVVIEMLTAAVGRVVPDEAASLEDEGAPGAPEVVGVGESAGPDTLPVVEADVVNPQQEADRG
jgi:preprotein translocase subunit YajC